jgi:hypothetical protein
MLGQGVLNQDTFHQAVRGQGVLNQDTFHQAVRGQGVLNQDTFHRGVSNQSIVAPRPSIDRQLCVDVANISMSGYLFRPLLRKLRPGVQVGILLRHHAAFQPVEVIDVRDVDLYSEVIRGIISSIVDGVHQILHVSVQYNSNTGVVFTMDNIQLQVEKIFIQESVHRLEENPQPSHGMKRMRD